MGLSLLAPFPERMYAVHVCNAFETDIKPPKSLKLKRELLLGHPVSGLLCSSAQDAKNRAAEDTDLHLNCNTSVYRWHISIWHDVHKDGLQPRCR